MKKSQLVSMDFVIAFVVFIFALAFFFSTMKNASSYEDINLDAPSELIFSRIEQVYAEDYDFLDGAIVDSRKLDRYIDDHTRRKTYDFIFKDFDNPHLFTRTDYCVFIENRTPEKNMILRNFAAGVEGNYTIKIGEDLCGDNPYEHYTDILPRCKYGEEALSLIKPVLYKKDIVDLRILICAKKR